MEHFIVDHQMAPPGIIISDVSDRAKPGAPAITTYTSAWYYSLLYACVDNGWIYCYRPTSYISTHKLKLRMPV